MLDVMRRRKQITKEDQFSTMPHHGRIIPTHGGGGRDGKEAHRSKQHHQLLLSPGVAPMAPRPDMPAEAAMRAGDGSSSSSLVKPGCMMELARLAKIPQPESGLVCPRCRSAETKFCYYNNYSLSQPRHFCRACRRYWTHGGAFRDLPFSSSVRRRRQRNKPPSNKHHASPKVASCCASGTTGRSTSSSLSSGASAVPGGGRVAAAAATAVMHTQALEQLASLAVAVGTERHTTVASRSRLWLPAGHSLLQGPVAYRHQLGNNITGAGVATTIGLEHHRYLPQGQPFSFLGYGDAVTAPTSDAGGIEAGGFAGGQMQAEAISRVLGPAALTTKLASEMMAENPPTPSMEMTGTLAATTSSPGAFLLVESGLSHLLGSGGSWAGSYGSCSAGNDGSGGSTSCTAAPGNSVWPDPSSGLTSSSSGTML